jgi:hypothetical protein
MHNAFRSLELTHGKVYSDLDPLFGSRLTMIVGGGRSFTTDDETHFVYCHKGVIRLTLQDNRFYQLVDGMYACLRGSFISADPTSYGVVITKPNYKGLFQIGGPIEEVGRLKYIDGCTDSLLISPVLKGDPCFNLLVFPPGIDQTMHTHPSVRLGMVTKGRGLCRYRSDPHDPLTESRTDLTPGMVFSILTDGAHAFSTPYGDPMTVVAYHPDSDFGPTHEEHPMLNRTIIDGVSAKDPSREQYRTK